mgnify:CR=1 FL=1
MKLFVLCAPLILLWGLVIAMCRNTRNPALFPLRAFATLYTDFFRGVPIILTIYIVGFGIPKLGLLHGDFKVLGKSLGYEIRTDQKINFREEINTLAKSGSTVSFKDGTALSIGEDSQMTIDEFVYDPASGSAKGAMRVVKGVLRFASGASKTKEVSIETQTAMIGIRGTILDVAADRQRTGVFVHVGQVTVQAVGNSLQLGAGQFALIEASGVPAIVPVPLWFIERTRGMASMLGLPEKPTAAAAAPSKGRATVAPLR